MRVLLIGRTGQLGGDLLRSNPGHEIIAPSRESLDIGVEDQVRRAIREAAADAVINCAAFHNVPLCEDRPEEALRINCVAVRNLALACRETGARLVSFSSDYVFSGDQTSPYVETDSPQPLQMYGISRLAGEHAALSAAPGIVFVIRTCGLYGASGARSKGGNFVDGRVADARAGKRIEMASEQTVAPTFTADLAGGVWKLMGEPRAAPGIYHLVNEGECTWYEFTRAIVELMDVPAEVVPVDRRGISGKVRRPLYSVLGNTRARALGVRLPPWRDALVRYLRSKYG